MICFRNHLLWCPSTFNTGLNLAGEVDKCLGGGVVDVGIVEINCLFDICDIPLAVSAISKFYCLNNRIISILNLLSFDNLRMITLSLT
jgi:hypothetical protein